VCACGKIAAEDCPGLRVKGDIATVDVDEAECQRLDPKNAKELLLK